ncbi:MAG: NUDIX hydrolase [Alphaproteobacteria bacterium]|nr:MAG: NUDIX hydrolase [Alphaproteobacteria bacterium]
MNKNPYFYIGENPTVDLIVINPDDEVLMITRSKNSAACPGMLAFPGGFIDSRARQNEVWKEGLETPHQAALRELAEETNLRLESNTELISVGVYVGNSRDPRDSSLSWSKTYAFLHRIDHDTYEIVKDKIQGQDDADEAKWIKVSELRKMKLAFDHNLILEDALKLL